jgi:hypothetical protein
MGSFRVLSQRTGRMATLAALVVATLGQAVLPALASADGVTSRSIALSAATADASGVTYKVSFTAATGVGAYIVEFCSDSPVFGQTCTAPGGFSAASAALGADGTTATAVTGSANKLVVTNTIAAAGSVTDTFTGIHNPTLAGVLYARIITFDDATNAAAATSDDDTGSTESGSVAISITNDVSVSGAVQESMQLCASAAAMTTNCAGATAPSLKLANANGALDSTLLTVPLYTQISTNASAGAVVSLKSDAAACGGLHRVGDAYDTSHCFIKPSSTTVADGSGLFGLKLSADDTSDATQGTFQKHTGSVYDTTNYKMGFDSAHPTAPESGVTSVYGDQILDTNGAPANSRNMTMTFGASASNMTPAGTYQTKLSLIATGTF